MMLDGRSDKVQSHPLTGFGTIGSRLKSTCSIPLRANSWMNLRNRRSISLLGRTALAKLLLQIPSCQRSPMASALCVLEWKHLVWERKPRAFALPTEAVTMSPVSSWSSVSSSGDMIEKRKSAVGEGQPRTGVRQLAMLKSIPSATTVDPPFLVRANKRASDPLDEASRSKRELFENAELLMGLRRSLEKPARLSYVILDAFAILGNSFWQCASAAHRHDYSERIPQHNRIASEWHRCAMLVLMCDQSHRPSFDEPAILLFLIRLVIVACSAAYAFSLCGQLRDLIVGALK